MGASQSTFGKEATSALDKPLVQPILLGYPNASRTGKVTWQHHSKSKMSQWN